MTILEKILKFYINFLLKISKIFKVHPDEAVFIIVMGPYYGITLIDLLLGPHLSVSDYAVLIIGTLYIVSYVYRYCAGSLLNLK